jgi:hypothetical protein
MSQFNPPELLGLQARVVQGVSTPLELYGLWIGVVWFSDPVFLINWVNSLLLIKIRESVSFHRPLKKGFVRNERRELIANYIDRQGTIILVERFTAYL